MILESLGNIDLAKAKELAAAVGADDALIKAALQNIKGIGTEEEMKKKLSELAAAADKTMPDWKEKLRAKIAEQPGTDTVLKLFDSACAMLWPQKK